MPFHRLYVEDIVAVKANLIALDAFFSLPELSIVSVHKNFHANTANFYALEAIFW